MLEKYSARGVEDFVVFQGYIPGCCCLNFAEICPTGQIGMILEGCCCPVLSLSIARIHLMDQKRIRPDPMCAAAFPELRISQLQSRPLQSTRRSMLLLCSPRRPQFFQPGSVF